MPETDQVPRRKTQQALDIVRGFGPNSERRIDCGLNARQVEADWRTREARDHDDSAAAAFSA
jgi:hypothetical protein